MCFCTRTFVFWVLTMLSSAALHASGIRIYLQDAAAVEQGNAFTATADNPSAIYYNPAGITQLTGHNLRSGLGLVYYNYDYRSNTGQEWDTIDHLRGVAQFFYTYSPDKPPFSFGLGVYSPYGLGSRWPDESPFRSLTKRADLLFLSFNPVVAWKVSDQLSVAAGPMLNYADLAGPSFTLGLGHQGKRSSWNAGYFVFYGLPRTVSGSALSPAGQSADGRYEGVVHFVSLSLGLQF